MSKRARPVATKTTQWKKKKMVKKDPLDRWALEPGFKANLKACDGQLSSFFTTNTSLTANLMNPIAQGVGDNMRIGQRVRYASWRVQGVITFDPQATGVALADYLRVIFVYDRQTNGAAPVYKDLIFNDNSGGSAAYDMANWYNRGRFKIIRDYKIATPPMQYTVVAGNISAITGSLTPQPTSTELRIDFYKNIKMKLDTIWNGTGSTVTNINGGGFWCFLQNTQGTNLWVCSFSSRLEYTDV